MAKLERDQIGVLDIELIQGDDKPMVLVFNTKNLDDETTPLDLRQYSLIRLDVKSQKDVNERPFLSWTVGKGLAISGDDFNVLNFEFKQEFNATAQTQWYYDIKFVSIDGVNHFVEGAISIKKTVTK